MTLIELRDKVDAFLPSFFTAMVAFQNSMYGSLGRYLQFTPTDPQIEGPQGVTMKLTVDVYETGGVHGWSATAEVVFNGVTYRRGQNGAGPDWSRTYPWTQITTEEI